MDIIIFYFLGVVFFTFFFYALDGYRKKSCYDKVDAALIIFWPATIFIGVTIIFFTSISEAGLWVGILTRKFFNKDKN